MPQNNQNKKKYSDFNNMITPDAGVATVVPTYADYLNSQAGASNTTGNFPNVSGTEPNVPSPNPTTGTVGGTYADGMTAKQIIEQQRQASYADAETARERAIVDAQTRYALSGAGYGTNAEKLAAAGLSGSGYGEYMQSQAYAQQRAGIQAANAQADAAKREADKVYYGSMLANEENLKAAYTNLLDKAKSGNYTAEEIGTLAGKYGITDTADLDTLQKAAGDEYIQKTITADTSDEEIAAKYAGNEQAAKEARKTMALDEIEGYADGREWTAADEAVEKYYKSGVLDDNDRQSYYMQNATEEIEEAAKSGTLTAKNAKAYEQALEKAKNEGKISNADYEAAKRYLYGNVATVVDGTKVEFEHLRRGSDKTMFSVKLNGEEISDASFGAEADSNTKNALTAVAGEKPTEGTLALYNDGVYVYINSHGYSGWYKASRNWILEGTISSTDNKRIYDIIKNDIAPAKSSTARPEHKADE